MTYPVGHVSTHKDGSRWRKQGPGQWVMVRDGHAEASGHRVHKVDVHKRIGMHGFDLHVKDHPTDKGKVTIGNHADSARREIPRESVRHMLNDLRGEVHLPPHESNADINAVLDGKAEFLGKGDDGLAFKVGGKVVKVSTVVPYQPMNPGHRTPGEAAEMLRHQVEVGNKLADAGVPVVRSKYVRHGDKGFQIKAHVEIPEKLTRAQLDEAQQALHKLHDAGYVLNDDVQVGLLGGKVVMYDTGKAAPVEPGDEERGIYSQKRGDLDRMEALYRASGERFVNSREPAGERHWRRVEEMVNDLFREGGPKRKPEFIRRHLKHAADARRADILATTTGEAQQKALDDLAADVEVKEMEIGAAFEKPVAKGATRPKIGLLTRKQRSQHPYHGTIDFQGIPIDVENRAGSVRRGTSDDGTPWKTRMAHHYGEFRGTLGVDGDPVDVYVGPDADSAMAVVINQKEPGKTGPRAFDEQKVMLGFATVDAALTAYRKHYDRPGFYGGHVTMSIGKLRRLLKEKRGMVMKSAGPYIGPRGGKWADAAHTVHWVDGERGGKQADWVGRESDGKRAKRIEAAKRAFHDWRAADSDWRKAKGAGGACSSSRGECQRAYQRMYDSLDRLGRALNLDVGRGQQFATAAARWLRAKGHRASTEGAAMRESRSVAAKPQQQALFKSWLRFIAKATFKRRSAPYIDSKGRRRRRYYYSEAAAAREAREGERINLGERGKHDVVAVHDDGHVTLKHAETGEERKVHASDLHREMHAAYKDEMTRGAERVIARMLRSAGAVTDTSANGLWAAYAKRFDRMGVSKEYARSLIEFIGARKGWSGDAKKVLAEFATHPKWSRYVRGRERMIAKGAETVAKAEKSPKVEAAHVARVAALPTGPKLEEIRSEVIGLVGKLQGALGAVAAMKGSPASKAVAQYAAEVAASPAVAKLDEVVKAYPGMADADEWKQLQQLRAKVHAVAGGGPGASDGRSGVRGAETTVFVVGADGSPHPQKAHYRLVEAHEAIASHDPAKGFAKNEAYPEGVQERHYHRDKEHQGVVRENARKLKPEMVINTNPDAVNGPPIVTADGRIVLGGNSRAMALQLAHAEGGEARTKYLDYLKANAASFGLSDADIGKLKNPVLVREVDTTGETKKGLGVLVRKYNEAFTQGMDPRVDQVARARLVSPGMLDTLSQAMGEQSSGGGDRYPTLKAYLGAASAKHLIASMEEAGVIDRRNRAVYLRKDGTLNEDGKTFVERLLVGKVLPHPDILSELQPSQVEAIARSVPHIVRASSHGHDISEPLRQALVADAYMRRHRIDSVENLDSSQTLGEYAERSGGDGGDFGGKPKLDAASRALLKLLHANRGPVQLSGAFRQFAQHAARNPKGQSDMFGKAKETHELLGDLSKPPQQSLFKGAPMPPTMTQMDARAMAAGYIAMPDGWLPVSKALGSNSKAYKVVPYIDKHGKRRARYYYHVGHGHGIHHEDHFVAGASFKYGDGRYHITAVHEDGTVTIRHDESGKELRMRKADLSAKLRDHHQKKLAAYVDKLKQLHADSKDGSHAKKRWAARLKKFGHDVDGASNLTDAEKARLQATIGAYEKAVERLKVDGNLENAAKMQQRVDEMKRQLSGAEMMDQRKKAAEASARKRRKPVQAEVAQPAQPAAVEPANRLAARASAATPAEREAAVARMLAAKRKREADAAAEDGARRARVAALRARAEGRSTPERPAKASNVIRLAAAQAAGRWKEPGARSVAAGQRVQYGGNMANLPWSGTIEAIEDGGERYRIRKDDGTVTSTHASMFHTGRQMNAFHFVDGETPEQIADGKRKAVAHREEKERDAAAEQAAYDKRREGWEKPKDRNEAGRRIKAALEAATGHKFSVTGGRGTGWSWISVRGRTPEAEKALKGVRGKLNRVLEVISPDSRDDVVLELEELSGKHGGQATTKTQPATPAGAPPAVVAQPAASGGVFGAHTYTTKKGKEKPALKLRQRVSREEWTRIREMAKEHNGWAGPGGVVAFHNDGDRDRFAAATSGGGAPAKPAEAPGASAAAALDQYGKDVEAAESARMRVNHLTSAAVRGPGFTKYTQQKSTRLDREAAIAEARAERSKKKLQRMGVKPQTTAERRHGKPVAEHEGWTHHKDGGIRRKDSTGAEHSITKNIHGWTHTESTTGHQSWHDTRTAAVHRGDQAAKNNEEHARRGAGRTDAERKADEGLSARVSRAGGMLRALAGRAGGDTAEMRQLAGEAHRLQGVFFDATRASGSIGEERDRARKLHARAAELVTKHARAKVVEQAKQMGPHPTALPRPSKPNLADPGLTRPDAQHSLVESSPDGRTGIRRHEVNGKYKSYSVVDHGPDGRERYTSHSRLKDAKAHMADIEAAKADPAHTDEHRLLGHQIGHYADKLRGNSDLLRGSMPQFGPVGGNDVENLQALAHRLATNRSEGHDHWNTPHYSERDDWQKQKPLTAEQRARDVAEAKRQLARFEAYRRGHTSEGHEVTEAGHKAEDIVRYGAGGWGKTTLDELHRNGYTVKPGKDPRHHDHAAAAGLHRDVARKLADAGVSIAPHGHFPVRKSGKGESILRALLALVAKGRKPSSREGWASPVSEDTRGMARHAPPSEIAPTGTGWQQLPWCVNGGMIRQAASGAVGKSGRFARAEYWWPSVGHAYRAAHLAANTRMASNVLHEYDKTREGNMGDSILGDDTGTAEAAARIVAGARRFMAEKMRAVRKGAGQRAPGRPLTLAEIQLFDVQAIAKGWRVVADSEAIWIAKGGGPGSRGSQAHKIVPYIDSKGRRRYRYYYSEGHGGGVHNTDHMSEGAAFRHGGGHYHIKADHGDGHVTVRHSETGHEHKIHKDELSKKLREHHKEGLDKYTDKVKALHEASKHNSHAKRRWKGILEKLGHKVEEEAGKPPAGHLPIRNDPHGGHMRGWGQLWYPSKQHAERAHAHHKEQHSKLSAEYHKNAEAIRAHHGAGLASDEKDGPALYAKRAELIRDINSHDNAAKALEVHLGKRKPGASPEQPKPRKLGGKVESSNIAAVHWSQGKGEEGTLRVEFKNGAHYEYDGVPRDQYHAIADADSAGKAYNAFRKTRGSGTSRKVKNAKAKPPKKVVGFAEAAEKMGVKTPSAKTPEKPRSEAEIHSAHEAAAKRSMDEHRSKELAHALRTIHARGGYSVKSNPARPGGIIKRLLDAGLIHEVDGKWQVWQTRSKGATGIDAIARTIARLRRSV